MVTRHFPFLNKALESLAGAELEFANGWHNNCANRCYYASFQAAIAALQHAGIQTRGGQWGHAFVPSQFEGVLINRQHRYPTELRTMLERAYALRQKADYAEDAVSRIEAERGLRRTRTFVTTIESFIEGGEKL